MDQNGNFKKNQQMATKVPNNQKEHRRIRIGNLRIFRRFNRWYNQVLEEYQEQNRLERIKLFLLIIIIILLLCILMLMLTNSVQSLQPEPQATETILFLPDIQLEDPTPTSTPKPTSTPEPLPDHK
jgi:hypothetical protein